MTTIADYSALGKAVNQALLRLDIREVLLVIESAFREAGHHIRIITVKTGGISNEQP